jgi:hypothetical protein
MKTRYPFLLRIIKIEYFCLCSLSILLMYKGRMFLKRIRYTIKPIGTAIASLVKMAILSGKSIYKTLEIKKIPAADQAMPERNNNAFLFTFGANFVMIFFIVPAIVQKSTSMKYGQSK